MASSPSKIPLDQLLVERGLAASRELAQSLIRAGIVVVGEQRVDKPGARVLADAAIRLKGGEPCPYVSRGGIKLAGALSRFNLTNLAGLTALDIGASTGGFTDCLLQHGAARVLAIDTGRGQLHEKLRQDPRVTLIENANARNLEPAWLGGVSIDLAAIDVSFISLKLILPPLPAILAPGARVVALVKPQFEALPADIGAGGVVRDRPVHRRVLGEILDFATRTGWHPEALAPSLLPGPAGNLEFFLLLSRVAGQPAIQDFGHLSIEQVLDEAYTLLKHPPAADGGEPEAPPTVRQPLQ